MSITQNIMSIRNQIPGEVQLVCVSKFHPDESILEAYSAGERLFGESKVQEMCGKYERLPKDIHWHFIGHLQSNKIKQIIPFVALIHGVDTVKLLEEINHQAQKLNKKVNCLLQVHIAQEETKFGFSATELKAWLATNEWNALQNVNLCGLMGMATFTDNRSVVANEFDSLKQLFDELKSSCFVDQPFFNTISMGMSDDFPIAIACGSTMVRVGSLIFGSRVY